MPQVARYPENLTATELLSLIKNLREPVENFEDEILSSLNYPLKWINLLKVYLAGQNKKYLQ